LENIAMKALLIPTLLFLLPMIALAADVPAEGKKSEAKNLLKPTNELESWVFQLTDDGQGEMKVDGDAIVFHTTQTTGTDWHVQAYQTEVDLKEGQNYVVKFQMKSPEPVQRLLVGQINEEDWHEIGLHEDLQPTKDYKDYEFTFTATDVVDKNNRIGFVLGIDKGVVSIKDLTLTEK
jgi:hypothetical protein